MRKKHPLFKLVKNYPIAQSQSPLHFDKFKPPPNFSYSNEELEESIRQLNLPTWSRSYVPCNSSKSEITCPQIVSAWRSIQSWIYNISHTPISKLNFIVTKHYFDGIGNRISIDTVVFLIALMSNRTMIVEGHYLQNGITISQKGNSYDYFKLILQQNNKTTQLLNNPKLNPPLYIQVFSGWWSNSYKKFFESSHYFSLDRLIYSSMIYTDPEMLNFILPRFGMHAVYFLSNFLVRIPEKNLNLALSYLKSIPSHIRAFGVHLRYQFAGQFYSYGVYQTLSSVRSFLRAQLKQQPTVFVFASDSLDVEVGFMLEFGFHSIQSNAKRKPDFDHTSALTDIAILMGCDECLLTYRSTFSYTVASRMGKRCWFVEKEAPSVFQASNSQAGAVSALFHNWDVNDWQTNRRFENMIKNENAFRYFYKYLLL